MNLTEEEKLSNGNLSSLQVTFDRSFGLFLIVYLSLVLYSPIKFYSLIHANKESFLKNIAKYITEITKLQWNIFAIYFKHEFYKTNKWISLY